MINLLLLLTTENIVGKLRKAIHRRLSISNKKGTLRHERLFYNIFAMKLHFRRLNEFVE
jgi:hypothetical protein